MARIDSPLAPAELAALTGEMLDRVSYCFVVFDAQGRYLHINATHAHLLNELHQAAPALIGTPAFSWATAAEQAKVHDIIGDVIASGTPHFENIWLAPVGRHYRQCFVPLDGCLVGMLSHDITAQTNAQRNAEFLAEVQRALYSSDDTAGVASVLREKISAYFGLDRLNFAEIDMARGYATAIAEFDSTSIPPDIACFRLEGFLDSAALSELANGRPVAIDDVESDPRARAEAFPPFGVRAMLVAPYLEGGRWSFTLTGISSTARAWRPDECQLFLELAARSYLHLERARADAGRRISEERLSLALDAGDIGTFHWNAATGISESDQRLRRLLGLPKNFNLTPQYLRDKAIHEQDREAFGSAFARAIDPARDGRMAIEFRITPPDGIERWLAMRAQAQWTADAPPQATGLIGVIQDITASKRIEMELRKNEMRLRALAAEALQAQEELAVSNERMNLAIEGSGDGVIDYVVECEGHTMSRRAWEILGYAQAPVKPVFHCWGEIVHPDERATFDSQLAAVLEHGSPSLSCEHRVRCQDGSWKWVQLRAHVVGRDVRGRALRLTGLLSDISEKRRSEEIIWSHANFDPLTALPNRRLFRDRLEHELKKSLRVGLPVALLFIDLDRFKEVNDLLGHAAGDSLLVQAARRISACVRGSDTVARLGGDEFTAVLPDLDDMRHAQNVAQKIIEALAMPFQLESESVYISASVGITLFPGDAQDAEDLIRNADQAMYAAKNAGRNQFSYFTPQMQSEAQNRLRLIKDLREALPAGQLEVFYQPLVDLATGHIEKAEALLRWRHPRRGLIDPVRFIPYAEEAGLISQIGDWVFREAAQRARYWQQALGQHIQVSINTSPLQFSAHRCSMDWSAQLAEMGLAGSSISVEITEGILLNASPSVTAKLEQYRDAGIEVAIDDFGTGYSSIAYLKKFDIDYLKIDQSFIRELETNGGDRVIVRSTIVMAHELGLRVIAEGIETGGQHRLLQEAGCDMGQGFLFSRPLPAAEFEHLLLAGAALH